MTYVKHEPCPQCGSRDNLAVYTDHSYCFGCGYIEFFNYHNRRIENVKDTDQKIVSLPEDIVSTIPAVADSWVRKYGLTLQELYENRVVWSDFRKLLIFPYFDDKGHLWGWQGRYFGDDPKHPKWTGKGNFKEQIKVYGNSELYIVLVEDIISCLKIARVTGSIPLFGSHVDLNKICKLNSIYKPKEFILWLDKDKMKEAFLYSNSINKLGITSKTISTQEDPKEFNTDQIKQLLNIP